LNFDQQDQLLLAWLLASMSAPILRKMVGLDRSYQVWKRLEIYYASHTCARVKKLKLQLRLLKKDKSINEYLLEIKKIVDSLATIGSAVSEEDHIEAIMDGLPEEYDSFVTSVTSRLDPYSVNDIEALLMAQEERFERHKKSEQFVILANTASASQNCTYNKGRGDSQNHRGGYNGHRGGRSLFRRNQNYNRGGRFFNNRGYGRSNWNQNSSSQPRVQCQICGRGGHIAADCWQRFNQDYQPPPQANNVQFSQQHQTTDQFNLVTPTASLDPLWYPDSGATHHITNDEHNLSVKTNYTAAERVRIGNGSGLHISHVGNSKSVLHLVQNHLF
jgi:histone deacetylase 1/2